jgi:tRNA pseudouridine32 synthase/23S rRNA pseudouridine746 synthase
VAGGRSRRQRTLPVRDGVAPSTVWLPAGPWPLLLDYLVERFPDVDREVWRSRMARGEVRDETALACTPQTPHRAGACVNYYRELEGETPIPFEEIVLHRDDHLLVVDKPHFLPVIPTGRYLHETLLVRLKKKTGLEHLTPIHRLDRETAGVMLFSHNLASRGAYQSLFQKRCMHKVYEALAAPLPDPRAMQSLQAARAPLVYRSLMVEGTPFFRMREAAGEPNSETRIGIIERRGDIVQYRLEPLTGRKHQLRLHMASLGAGILNDSMYPDLRQGAADDLARPLCLLARSISFDDPLTGARRQFASSRSLWDSCPD